MQHRRLFVRIAALILSITIYMCSLALIQPPGASAHAFVIGSDPVDGSTITQKPKAVRITFNTAISPLSTGHVYFVQQGQLVDVGTGTGQIESSKTLVTPLQPADKLAEGSYMVRWSAVADDDGHVTHGIIGFNIGFSATGLAGTPTLGPSTSNDLDDSHALDVDHSTGILMVLWEWFVLLTLTFWIGMQVMERLVLANSGHGLELLTQASKRTAALHWLCPFGLLAGDAILLFLRAMDRAQIQFQGHFSLSLLSDLIVQTNYGHLWLVRSLLLLLALGWLYWDHLSKIVPAPPEVPRPSSPVAPEQSGPEQPTDEQEEKGSPMTVIGSRPILRKLVTRELITRDFEPTSVPPPASARLKRITWLLLAAALALLFTLTSPAQALQPRLSALFFSWLNLMALGLWFGSFAYLATILLPLFGRKDLDFTTEALITLQRRLTPFLLMGICIQLASAFFLSDASVSGPQQLFGDPYGITLLALLGLAGIMLLLSLYVLFILRPRLTRQIRLLPVVGPELPTRRIRQLELGQNGRRLKLIVRLLALLGAGLLLCLSLMDYFAPPIVFPDVNYSSTQGTTSSTQQTRQIGDLSVTMEVLPGLSSAKKNTVIVLITDGNGQPVTNAQVSLRVNMQAMDMGTGHATIQGGQTVYAATLEQNEAFNMAGLWLVDVKIERAGQAMQEGQFQIMISS